MTEQRFWEVKEKELCLSQSDSRPRALSPLAGCFSVLIQSRWVIGSMLLLLWGFYFPIARVILLADRTELGSSCPVSSVSYLDIALLSPAVNGSCQFFFLASTELREPSPLPLVPCAVFLTGLEPCPRVKCIFPLYLSSSGNSTGGPHQSSCPWPSLPWFGRACVMIQPNICFRALPFPLLPV